MEGMVLYMVMQQRQLNKSDAINLYNSIFDICTSDGFVLEIDGIPYSKDNLSYDFIVENVSRITAIESKSIPNSKIYASNFVQLIVVLSLNRIKKDPIDFVRTNDEIVTVIYNTLIWCLDSGYNSAISDAKSILHKMAECKTSVEAI